MKNYLIILGILISVNIYSQNKLNYELLENEPPLTPRLSLNADLFHLEMSFKALDATSTNVGLWGHYEVLPEKIGIQYLYRRSWFMAGMLGTKNFPAHNELEVGAYYTLLNKLKTKRTKITLDMEYNGTTYSTNVQGDRTYKRSYTETYIVIPSEKKILTQARFGFINKSFGNNLRFLGDAYNFSNNPEAVKEKIMGVYLGINHRTLTSVFIKSEKYGVQFHSIGRDLYLDLLFLPVNKFHDFENDVDVTDDVKSFFNKHTGPIGFRAGWKLFQIDKRTKTGKTFGLNGTFEFGTRPYLGWFVAGGIGMTILK